MSIGENIKKLREKIGMSQEELADLMGYSHKSSINKIEMGKQDVPQSKVILFAKIFNVTPGELIDYNQNYENQHNEVTKLVSLFSKLNQKGKKKAIESLQDLNKINEYIV